MDRRDTMLGMFDAAGFGLEIGPSYNPLLPKSAGYNVEILDHADQAALISKYRDDPYVDETLIEPVDHVSDGRPMLDVIGAGQRYDFVVASHVIEHTPSPLGFLRECEQLLRPGGVIFLAVPDKRFCFDHFRPVSTTGMVLQAHWERRTRHARSALFDQNAHYCEVGGRAGWQATETAPPKLRFDLHRALIGARERETDVYVDCHGWQFTPSSFRLLMSDLAELGELSVRELDFRTTPDFEFFVTLSAAGTGPGASRQELMEAALREGAPIDPEAVSPADFAAQAAELAAVKASLEATQREVQALRASTSWRITAPLRALKR